MARALVTVSLLGALGACAGSPATNTALWPGPDWRTAAEPAVALEPAVAGEEEAPRDDTPTKRPRQLKRRGSSTPPDLLFPNPQDERRPQVVQPTAPPPVVSNLPRNDVLTPQNPLAPYSAGGAGYQRQGTTIVGPTGNTYNKVGSSIIGPGGRACSAVGNSLFCN
jgi:hypothetical protein